MKLRDYQQAAVDAVFETWRTHRSCVVILPTGCGKTVVFAEVIRRALNQPPATTNQQPTTNNNHQPSTNNHQPPSRAMVLAHREELINQAAEKIKSITGADVGIEMGALVADGESLLGPEPPVVVSTVQTQITGRIGKFLPEDFATLVIDEAHHATSKSYRRCVEHYFENPGCRLLGVTATPDRADERALGLVFEKVAFEYSVSDAIRDGWLVPVKQKLVKVENLDFSGISTTAGDFNQGELAEVLEEERNLHAVAGPTVEICGTRRAIVFAASVKQAERLAEIINRFGKGRADWLCGKTPKDDRHAKLEAFRTGSVQFLVNVGVLTEGFDDAGVEVVVMARPTKSRALYAQMAGRATRPAAEVAARLGEVVSCSLMVDGSLQTTTNQQPPTTNQQPTAAAARHALIAASSKPNCLIVDFVGNSGRHKLVSTADILGGKFGADDEDEAEARRRVAKKAAESGAEVNTLEELEKARAEIRERKLRDAAERKFIQAKAKYTVLGVNPFDVFELAPVDRQARTTNRIRLSWKQEAILREKLKVDPAALSPSEGRALLDEYFRRLKAGLASYGQMKYLRRRGFPAPMTFAEASATIAWLRGGAA